MRDRKAREQRKTEIANVVAQYGKMTLAEIGRAVGLKKTPYLRGIVDELIMADALEIIAVDNGGNLPTFLYRKIYYPEFVENSEWSEQ